MKTLGLLHHYERPIGPVHCVATLQPIGNGILYKKLGPIAPGVNLATFRMNLYWTLRAAGRTTVMPNTAA